MSLPCIQHPRGRRTTWTPSRAVRTMRPCACCLTFRKLDDCFGDFVRVTCPCGTCRHIEPEALARMTGRSATLAALAERMRCSQCGKKVAEVVAVARPRPRGTSKD